MIETIVEYVLKYIDPDRTVEGPEKTRRFFDGKKIGQEEGRIFSPHEG